MFLVPRLRPDGTRNAVRIDRLKDKLGSRSMASGEVTLADAWARPVGSLTNGFRQMAEMVNASRLSNAMRAAALMRRAVSESVRHTRARVVFGRPLFDQPLMRATLLPLMLDAEAGLAMVLDSAAWLDRADAGEPAARRLVRVLTPLAKYTLCKRARAVTGEAMEVRGGNGYIEDWVNPRLLRDAHLGSIWEGSSNVIALDVLRCMRRDGAHRLVADVYRDRAGAVPDADASGAAGLLTRRWNELREAGDRLLERPPDEQEVCVARYATAVSEAAMATVLAEHAGHELAAGHGHRALLVAHAYLDRVLGDGDTPNRPALDHLDALADGGAVPRDAAVAALPTEEMSHARA